LSQESGAEYGQPLRFGLALHVGEVLYGNIGAPGRLDFTCIGPAVNLAARLEKVAARLGRTVIASAKFAEQSPAEMEELGEFEVAGFAAAQTAYGLRDETGTPAVGTA
jgi:adenylate cyclase